MKYILAFLLCLSAPVSAKDGLYVFGGFFAFDDTQTVDDYKGLSPHGTYGIKWRTEYRKAYLDIGLKHDSSASYREEGKGFNGPFIEGGIRLF